MIRTDGGIHVALMEMGPARVGTLELSRKAEEHPSVSSWNSKLESPPKFQIVLAAFAIMKNPLFLLLFQLPCVAIQHRDRLLSSV